ncbi:unnamed protein product [Rotaria magnacalcarata]|uniref:Protein kinase domain-containing protein n=1 Tax=Rotaria magnacalcarata TaxID=392030 RepID=A0A816PY52_9BILA|nr:unnamed protein product [Rotaria magnacalcarata]CAF3723725.1 unnamed protein product [Rotaria magnacalcarata]
MIGKRIFVSDIPYTIEGKIGHGLHSIVYGARDLNSGEYVAIKIISFTPGSASNQQLFQKELDMLLYLQELNPYVIRVFNYDYNERYGVIVMEYGKTLRDTFISYVISGKRMSPSLIHSFWSQMVQAIYYMHQIGIVHADCKPENFIQVGPGGTNLRLIDMGISFQLPANMTSRLQTAAGTPDYVSPEMVNTRVGLGAQSKYGYKSDIWALGIILFEMTFGFRPLQNLGGNRTKLTFLARLTKRDIVVPNHPDRDLYDIIRWCLRSNPRRRPTIEQILNHPYLTQKR